MGDDEYFAHFGFREIDLIRDTQAALIEFVPVSERV